MTECAAWVHERTEGVELLVNNAGVLVLGGLDETSWEDWERVLRVNLWGVIHGCQLFVPAMRRRGRGHVVNIASAAGVVGRSEEHTSELQSRPHLVCRLLLEKKKYKEKTQKFKEHLT